jgi:hypothetical protein
MFGTMARRAMLTAATAALIAGLGASSALATTTLSVPGTANLIGKVVVQVPVTATCGPFDPAPAFFSFGTSVTVTQAHGKLIAQGSGLAGVNTTGQSVPVVCDGTPQSFVVNVPANTSGPPFKKGTAVVSATATAGAFPTFESASVGPQTIKLR